MNDYHWQLIAKHLAKETSSKEEEELKRLTETDAEFAKALSDARELWDGSEIENRKFDKERIIKLRDEKIRAARRFGIRRILAYAAVITGLIIGAFFLFTNDSATITITAGDSKPLDYVLPDGSSVTLAPGASVSFCESFDRKVKLIEGESFFSVKKAGGKQFTVITGDYNIKVVGTKFDVTTDNLKTRVVLAEGKVILDNFDNKNYKNIVMKPGDKISYNRRSGLIKHSVVNPAVYYLWKEKRIHFNEFSMKDISEIFRIYYHKTLIINDDQTAGRRLGGSAPTDDINLIIKGLSEVLHRNITQSNDTIIIK
jgi:ferric-dicitrate binding protein FerR (iron transport regulator)